MHNLVARNKTSKPKTYQKKKTKSPSSLAQLNRVSPFQTLTFFVIPVLQEKLGSGGEGIHRREVHGGCDGFDSGEEIEDVVDGDKRREQNEGTCWRRCRGEEAEDGERFMAVELNSEWQRYPPGSKTKTKCRGGGDEIAEVAPPGSNVNTEWCGGIAGLETALRVPPGSKVVMQTTMAVLAEMRSERSLIFSSDRTMITRTNSSI